MKLITISQINEALRHKELINALETAFREEFEMPNRHHHFYRLSSGQENTLLLMPAWANGYMGIKQVISAPANAQIGLPTIHGTYTLSNAATGQPLAVMDAAGLTAIRTACASALAAKYLARKNAKTLLVVGAGKVATQLIHAHLAINNYTEVLVWMRKPEAFQAFKNGLGDVNVPVHLVDNLEIAVKTADVISCATLSNTPLIKGEWLRSGQHLDLVGSFKMNMREVDDEAVKKSSLFVDSKYGAVHESGELGIPLKNNIISQQDIRADIIELCQGKHKGRENEEEITLFKSVGIAIEDLVAALVVYKRIIAKETAS